MEYCLFFIQWWPLCMSKSEWSSWVQAIGSIGAILIAGWAVRHQVKKAQVLQRESVQEQRVHERNAELRAFKLAIAQYEVLSDTVRTALADARGDLFTSRLFPTVIAALETQLFTVRGLRLQVMPEAITDEVLSLATAVADLAIQLQALTVPRDNGQVSLILGKAQANAQFFAKVRSRIDALLSTNP